MPLIVGLQWCAFAACLVFQIVLLGHLDGYWTFSGVQLGIPMFVVLGLWLLKALVPFVFRRREV